MSGIYHNGKEWANVTTPNPAGTASTDLTKVGINGTNYNIKDANAAPNTPTFTEASTRANLAGSGENMATILGKIKKWFTDLGTAAFKNVPSSGNASTTEVVMGDDTRLSDTRTPTAHNQASDTINAMTGYSKPSSTSAIATSDTLNAAIGKLEKALDGKSGTDEKVKQTESTGSSYNSYNYEMLMGATADSTTRTEGTRKSANIKCNPYTGTIMADAMRLRAISDSYYATLLWATLGTKQFLLPDDTLASGATSLTLATREFLKSVFDFWTVINSYSITTTKTQVSTYSSRKLSDYMFLLFYVYDSSGYRASMILPSSTFKSSTSLYASLTWVNSSNTQYWVEATYVSDTKIAIQGKSNTAGMTMNVVGILKAI